MIIDKQLDSPFSDEWNIYIEKENFFNLKVYSFIHIGRKKDDERKNLLTQPSVLR